VNLNVLLRGQSNAFFMGELSSGAQTMIRGVEALLGFDRVNDRVTLQYARDPDGNITVAGWQVDDLEQSLLNYIGNRL
jgi:hypothetical protein